MSENNGVLSGNSVLRGSNGVLCENNGVLSGNSVLRGSNGVLSGNNGVLSGNSVLRGSNVFSDSAALSNRIEMKCVLRGRVSTKQIIVVSTGQTQRRPWVPEVLISGADWNAQMC